ncbi:Similar to S.cerevisiae protein SIN3 (Component of both the Rpd3S and Rpd3L histone deacetylase complexes) [Malassezia sympodialis ATCC 42132]|uniref:Similar to S.cerevisiae protein SIN3 (Component of both the Rpd3S and Rpd3L histone deacetylase complexes) n=1 Tax=Malassezia sympodialis (strain ATCC 42132) TaxID=1230383 RepID=A0A1M8A7S5_MALS4|nr:Similar to S.cerevisiae protein SIN3 (Component of both the Rpd3S and Rpd3L histone deacetylase complexes) [Malassezia sympodialis ATCC 42132]
MATLNVRDALSYLDQVKVQFTDHPDVYNRFLDIMKDFKSQAIDTPGVIDRVSTLFRGQPSLIQGFNTFLPPGYRIECSMDQNDGNFITVTTPSGTTTQALGGHGPPALHRLPDAPPPGPPPMPLHEGARPPPAPGPGPGPGPAPGPQAYVPAPEYAERAPLPGPALSRAPPLRGASPGPMGMPPMAAPGAYAGAPPGAPLANGPPVGYEPMARGAPEPVPRPPVEFNHAINYVNKIKQRFSAEPDTYKQFLEILQTYQKEQRPIHEVYAQVTVLFDHAKDLLEEFQQFLPDTGAAPGGSGLFGMLGHVTNGMGPAEGAPPGAAPYDMVGGVPRHAAPPLPRKKRMADEPGVPPEASLPPPKAGASRKRSKKAEHGLPPPGAPYVQAIPGPGEVVGDAVYPPGAPLPPGYEAMPPEGYVPAGAMYGLQAYPPPHMVGGELVPVAPMATMDEVAFFERVKKHLDDRATYLDFLKLLNLYTQEVIDVATLVDRASLFLGGHSELFDAFKQLVGYDMGRHGWLEHEDPVLENVPALERERFDLSTQKSYGPSYRKLPESEVNLSCSGRDALCWEVLNDGWVSYPTWASEGESFNPHKKNVYEDALYRSEEERHEYDYHIEANLRTIALLEPIAARIAVMDAEERAAFRLKPGLGGQSKSIYQRIIKKVYGRSHGLEVIAALHDNPSVAVPVVLARLKQKDEEWKRAQREWNKVWREVDARNFYKALDHQGVNFKSTDKKAITNKAFVQEMETLQAAQQQRRLAADPSLPRLVPRFQLAYAVHDTDVLVHVLQLLAQFLERSSASTGAHDRPRVLSVLHALLPRLWGVPLDTVRALIVPHRTSAPREASDEPDAESASASPADDDGPAEAPVQAIDTWHVRPLAPHTDAQPTPRALPETVQLFGNTTLYVLVRLLHLLYERLHRLKCVGAELAARTPSSWTKVNPLAATLGLADIATGPAGLVASIAAHVPGAQLTDAAHLPEADQAVMRLHPAQFYAVTLELIARLLDNEVDQSTFEEAVRFMYTKDGYVLFTIDKVLQALVKTAVTVSTDAKGQALLAQFEATQQALEALRADPDVDARDVQMYQRLVAARMEAEHTVGREEPLFRIEVAPVADAPTSGPLPARDVRIQLLSHDDTTLDDPQDAEQRWLQYIASYCLWAPTEGLPAQTRAPLLQRNLPAAPEDGSEADGSRFLVKNGLDIRVCMKTYRLFFVQDTEDVLVRVRPADTTGAAARHAAARRRKWHEWLDVRLEAMREAPGADADASQAEAAAARRD